MNNFDQAENLRKLASKKIKEKSNNIRKPKIIAVTSGKGGVGKSNFVLNSSMHLHNLGKNVLIFDADLGLANIDILLGVSPKLTLENVISNKNKLQDIIYTCNNGLKLISSGSGIKELANINELQLQRLIYSFENLDDNIDYLIIDTGAGIHNSVVNFLLSSDEIVVITTPEPTALADAYALIKIIMRENVSAKIRVVLNMVKNLEQGFKVFEKINLITNNFLNFKIEFLGSILYDENVSKAIRLQKPIITAFPFSNATKNIVTITEKMSQIKMTKDNKGFKDFLHKLNYYFKREKITNE